MRLIVHPGLPKAGSTTIQAFMRKYETRLRAAGVGSVQTTERSAAERAEQILSGAKQQADAGMKHVIVSQEALAGWPRVRVERLVSDLKLASYDVEVVLVLRQYEPWAVSMAMQRVRTLRGYPMRDPEPVWEWLDTWHTAGAPLKIVPLESKQGLLPSFMAAAGIDVPEEWMQKAAGAINKSPSAQQFGAFILLDRAIAIAAAVDPDVLADKNVLRIKKMIRGLLDGGEHHRKPIVVRVDDEFRAELLDYLILQLEEPMAATAGENTKTEAQIRSAFKAARRGVAVDSESARKAAEQFTAVVKAGLPPEILQLRRWCAQPGHEVAAGIMLPEGSG